MPRTYAQEIARLRRRVTDASGARWTSFEILQAMQGAVDVAWPDFWVDVYDDTTFAGVNAVAVNTSELAVPATFLASGTGYNTVPAGLIWALEYRNWNGSTSSPVPAPWIFIRKGVVIDPLDYPTPKIRFVNPFSWQYELRLIGGIPITPPSIYDFTADSATNIITPSGGTWTNGQTVVFDTDIGQSLPTGLSKYIQYYVVNTTGTTFKVALTAGGTAVVLATNGAGQLGVTSDLVGESTDPAYLNYFENQVRAYLHQSRVTAGGYDRDSHSQRYLIAQQDANDARKRGSPRSHETLFNKFGRR